VTAVRDVLRDAAELLRTKGWTQNTSARNDAGRAVSALDAGAVCFCAMGALSRVAAEGCDDKTKDAAIGALRLAIGIDCGIASWNDAPERRAEDVVAAFERAADLAAEVQS
jgi:hypothetical protein